MMTREPWLADTRNPLTHFLLKRLAHACVTFTWIPLQFTRPGQLISNCKRTFQSSSLARIGPQEDLISTH
ncbi:unnamed protein product [Nezara viridula]|uniref:Uncharacterized protein n=1 Tax=Nezara viridula TaxID=85310 RepID=A0A9P0H7C8_NEZVI|nr:unnamed protein product [Nezara viridula]